MMKAMLLTAPGGPEVLKYQDTPIPELPDPHHVRVKLQAAGVNPVDYKLRLKGGFFPEHLPTILGCDGAGMVESVGEAVTRFQPGDEVYFYNGGVGGPQPGNYAEYTVVHEEYAAAKPAGLSMSEAAALPLAWITAWESLVDRARLQAGQTVLIHAGAGGVGHLAVQLAKSLGASVAVTVSNEEKANLARELGADHCIDYAREDFVQATLDWTDGQGADVVFDTVGGETFCRCVEATKIYGHLVTLLEYVCEADMVKQAKLRNLAISYELMLTPMLKAMHQARIAQRRMLDDLRERINRNEMKVVVSRTFPLAEAAEAQRLVEEGHVTGKIVLNIA